MANPPPSFYDPNDPQWQYVAVQQPTQTFEFSYPAPGPSTTYDELFTPYSQYPQYPGPSYTQPTVPPPTRKRRRVVETTTTPSAGYSDVDVESDDGLGSFPVGGASEAGFGPRPTPRLSGACTHCRKLKMKCEFPRDNEGKMDNTCRRCRTSGHVCTVERRKPRSAPK
ncbi:hypothetical protein C8F01DRAFT_1251097 [Mycena amicta]|nr:hypothetical protein C8F01DRAFT_1251097 [Mycena amicta]